jgi:hypothetical protein
MSSKTDDHQVVRIPTTIDEEFDETVVWERDMKPLYDTLVHMCEKLKLPSMLLIQFKAQHETSEEIAAEKTENDITAVFSISHPPKRPNEIVDANVRLLRGELQLYDPIQPRKDEVWLNHPGSDAQN